MHPEFSFKFLHWSQKLSLENVRLQIGALQSDVYWYIHVFVNLSEFIYLTQVLTVGGWKDPSFNCRRFFQMFISHCAEQFKHKREVSTI